MKKEGGSLDHLMEQNETELLFLSAYGGGENIEELLVLIDSEICEGMTTSIEGDAIRLECKIENLPLVPSDLQFHGFEDGKLAQDRSSMSVLIQYLGPDQKRLISRIVEFIHAS